MIKWLRIFRILAVPGSILGPLLVYHERFLYIPVSLQLDAV
jgi:hypothetical protein